MEYEYIGWQHCHVENPDIVSFLMKGVCFTLLLAVVSITASLGIASVLALVRNYCTRPAERVFRWAATAYIELFRNTPLLFWIFIGTVFSPLPVCAGCWASALWKPSCCSSAPLP